MHNYFVGTLISGTHCSRIFSDCDKKACRLQSPNYPGVYPRNLTCYYAIRQVFIKHLIKTYFVLERELCIARRKWPKTMVLPKMWWPAQLYSTLTSMRWHKLVPF